MEPKWFRPHDVAEGHEVYAVIRDNVIEGMVTGIDNDGHYVVCTDESEEVVCVRSNICHTAVSQSTPSAPTVRDTAELRHDDERNTVKLFSRSAEGRRTRQRAVRGELTPEEIAEISEIFHPLLRHLQSPISSMTEATVVPSNYATMAQGDGTPNPVTFDDHRRKLGGIAKQKSARVLGQRTRSACANAGRVGC